MSATSMFFNASKINKACEIQLKTRKRLLDRELLKRIISYDQEIASLNYERIMLFTSTGFMKKQAPFEKVLSSESSASSAYLKSLLDTMEQKENEQQHKRQQMLQQQPRSMSSNVLLRPRGAHHSQDHAQQQVRPKSCTVIEANITSFVTTEYLKALSKTIALAEFQEIKRTNPKMIEGYQKRDRVFAKRYHQLKSAKINQVPVYFDVTDFDLHSASRLTKNRLEKEKRKMIEGLHNQKFIVQRSKSNLINGFYKRRICRF